MSVLDEMTTLERKIATRIKELEPLAAEHERLRQYADKLGLDLSAAAKPRAARRARSTARKRATTRKPAATRSKRTTAPKPAATASKRTSSRAVTASGNGAPSRADQLAELVNRKPGMTVRQAADELGLKDPTSLYRPLRRLEQAGKLRKTKGKLQPVK